jgi:hypothetical protein
MFTTYDLQLPKTFDMVLTASRQDVALFVAYLVSLDAHATRVSRLMPVFAVTMSEHADFWNLWLNEATYVELSRSGLPTDRHTFTTSATVQARQRAAFNRDLDAVEL